MQKHFSKPKKTAKKTPKFARQPEEYRDRNGELVLDLAAVSENHKRAARQVLNFLDSEVVPLWLKEAVEDAIVEACRRKVGSPAFTPVRRALGRSDTMHDYPFTGEWVGVDRDAKTIKILADLFTLTSGKTFTVHLSEREKLAQAIKEILNNELTPERLFRDVGNFFTDISSRLNTDSFERINAALAFGDCGYIGCPGTTNGSVCPGPSAHPSTQCEDTREVQHVEN